MKLLTTDTDLRDLERACEGRGDLTRVPRQALRHLVADHYELLAKATGPVLQGGKGHKVEAGPDQESMR